MGKLLKFVMIGTVGASVGITGLQEIGRGAEEDFQKMNETQIADYAPEASLAQTDEPTTPDAPELSSAPVKAGQLDEMDKLIAATINLNGYLCARPIEVRDASAGLYAVRCVTNRNGSGISDYLVNSRTNEVTPI